MRKTSAVRATQFSSHLTVHQLLLLVALLATTCSLAVAQRTVVQDAGGGRKLELHYNAEGKVAEIRTIGPDGQLLQQQTLEYPAGAYVPNSTATSYWPNNKVHKVTRNTYDNNANFTGEFVQVFDESGKQTAGHRLVHDPQNNSYHCADWNVAKQDYLPVQCPAGEESSGPPETVKKFTQDDVMQQLAKARAAAQRAEKPVAQTPAAAPLTIIPQKSSSSPPPGWTVKEMGLIFPAKIRPGDRVSGSVVDDPSDYESQPGITVTRIALPFAPSGPASTLAGWTVEMSGEPPRPASGPVVLTIPPGQLELAVLFHPTDSSSGVQVSKAISLPNSPKPKRPTSYLAPALCLKGQLCVVRGPFSGDASKTFAAFLESPARILAETLDSVYLAIPNGMEPGSRPLVIAEGSKAIAFPMVVAEFSMRPEARDVKQGEQSLLYQSLDGPQELPDPLWLPGNYPATNIDEAQKLVSGFQVPKASREANEKHEAEEKREAKEKSAGQGPDHDEDMGGEILLVVKNLTPDMVTLRDSQNGMYVFHLKASSFQMGGFVHKGVVEANKTGSFGVKGYVIPFLAPVPGQVFAITESGAGK
jgi:hypothetical protein